MVHLAPHNSREKSTPHRQCLQDRSRPTQYAPTPTHSSFPTADTAVDTVKTEHYRASKRIVALVMCTFGARHDPERHESRRAAYQTRAYSRPAGGIGFLIHVFTCLNAPETASASCPPTTAGALRSVHPIRRAYLCRWRAPGDVQDVLAAAGGAHAPRGYHRCLFARADDLLTLQSALQRLVSPLPARHHQL